MADTTAIRNQASVRRMSLAVGFRQFLRRAAMLKVLQFYATLLNRKNTATHVTNISDFIFILEKRFSTILQVHSRF